MTSIPPGGPTRVLLVEHRQPLAQRIMDELAREGCVVETVDDAATARERIDRGHFDIVLLDWGLREPDRCTVCRLARDQGDRTPVLLFGGEENGSAGVCGSDAATDGCVSEPGVDDLLQRVRSIARGWSGSVQRAAGPRVLRFGENEIDLRRLRVRTWDGTAGTLTDREATILETLAERPGEIVTREDLMEEVWGLEAFPSTRAIDHYIHRLRRRFERDPADPRYLHIVRGVGYRFTPEGERW